MNYSRVVVMALVLIGCATQVCVAEPVAAPAGITFKSDDNELVTISAFNLSEAEFAEFIAEAVDPDAPISVLDKGSDLSVVVPDYGLLSTDRNVLSEPYRDAPEVRALGRKSYHAFFHWHWDIPSTVRCTDIRIWGGYAIAWAYFNGTYPSWRLATIDSVNSGGCP